MKIIAPALKLDMVLSDVVLREGRPVIVCRMGVYDATTELSKEDVGVFLKCMLRPSVFLAFAKITLSRSKPKTAGP
ncbi:MAG: hypothetical protein QM773_05035 [Hyphomonadaceae bacterium]